MNGSFWLGAPAREILPLETRALAIATFHALGTAIGGASAPLQFGYLIATGSPKLVAAGYGFAAALMPVAAVVEARFGMDAEGRSLEPIADPLSSQGTDRSRAGKPWPEHLPFGGFLAHDDARQSGHADRLAA